MMRRSTIVLRSALALPVMLLLVVLGASAFAADITVPALSGRVVDQAGVLSSGDEDRLTGKLRSFEERTGIQLVVVTLKSLQGHPIEDWGLALGRTWGIGQKGKDNGALLIVAPNDRELRIEVGYGLEGALPDATANAIIRNVIVPRFKAGDMAGGISDGVNAIISALTGSGEDFTPSKRQVAGQMLSDSVPVLFILLFVLLIVIGQVVRAARGGRYYRNSGGGWTYYDNSYSGSGFHSSGFGGGSSGGGFSGGGGSFGGGGSSGRW